MPRFVLAALVVGALGRRARAILLLLLGLLAGWSVSLPARAHDLPDEILVQMFVKPEGPRLHVLARVPLALLEGVALPKRGAGYLDLPRLDDGLERAALAVARTFVLLEGDARLTPERAAWRISQPSEAAFGSFEEARAHVLGPPLPDDADVFWNQGYYDVYLEYPASSDRADFVLDTQARGLGGILKLQIQYLAPDGSARAYEIHGDHGRLILDPSWSATTLTFLALGFHHILGSLDPLLLLLCLALPVRAGQWRRLAAVVAAFAGGHALTSLGVALGGVPAGDWFRPLIELLIAASIVYLALENIVHAWIGRGGARLLRWRWLTAGAIGLAYGFGLSFALVDQQPLAGDHQLSAVLAVNVGAGLGQIACLLIAVPALTLALRSPRAQQIGIVIGSALIAHTAWHWMLERAEPLRYVRWPELPSLWAVAAFGAVAIVVAVALAWLWQRRGLMQRMRGPRGAP